jgi:hypothetical protein
MDYNEFRPHDSLGDKTPMDYMPRRFKQESLFLICLPHGGAYATAAPATATDTTAPTAPAAPAPCCCANAKGEMTNEIEKKNSEVFIIKFYEQRFNNFIQLSTFSLSQSNPIQSNPIQIIFLTVLVFYSLNF